MKRRGFIGALLALPAVHVLEKLQPTTGVLCDGVWYRDMAELQAAFTDKNGRFFMHGKYVRVYGQMKGGLRLKDGDWCCYNTFVGDRQPQMFCLGLEA